MSQFNSAASGPAGNAVKSALPDAYGTVFIGKRDITQKKGNNSVGADNFIEILLENWQPKTIARARLLGRFILER